MPRTITRAMLSETAAETTGCSKFDTTRIGERMFELISEALMERETVKLSGFASLQVRSRAERIGRNPRTGTEHRIPPRHTVVLTPSAKMRQALVPRQD